jgi:hypothetical protein
LAAAFTASTGEPEPMIRRRITQICLPASSHLETRGLLPPGTAPVEAVAQTPCACHLPGCRSCSELPKGNSGIAGLAGSWSDTRALSNRPRSVGFQETASPRKEVRLGPCHPKRRSELPRLTGVAGYASTGFRNIGEAQSHARYRLPPH